MEQVRNMKFIDFEETLDRGLGKVLALGKRQSRAGTPKRDAFESSVDEAVHAYKLGEAIKNTRLEQHLTQEETFELK